MLSGVLATARFALIAAPPGFWNGSQSDAAQMTHIVAVGALHLLLVPVHSQQTLSAHMLRVAESWIQFSDAERLQGSFKKESGSGWIASLTKHTK